MGRPLPQQRCQGRWLIAKHGHPQRRSAGRRSARQSQAVQPAFGLLGFKRCHALDQACFAQQAAGLGGEARIKKPFAATGGRPVLHRRGQGVAARHIGFGRQVFKVEPAAPGNRTAVARQGRSQPFTEKFRGYLAAEGFHQHLARIGRQQGGQRGGVCGLAPGQHCHAGRAQRCHPAQGRRIVHPQTHRLPAGGQVGAQAPAHAKVTEVVDDFAKNVPLQAAIHHRIVHNTDIAHPST